MIQKKKSILSMEISSRHWKLLTTKCRSRSSYEGRGWLTQCQCWLTWSLYPLQCKQFIFPFNRKQLGAFQPSFERLKVLLAARTSLDLKGKGLTKDCLELEGLKWPEALKRFPPPTDSVTIRRTLHSNKNFSLKGHGIACWTEGKMLLGEVSC